MLFKKTAWQTAEDFGPQVVEVLGHHLELQHLGLGAPILVWDSLKKQRYV